MQNRWLFQLGDIAQAKEFRGANKIYLPFDAQSRGIPTT